MAILMGSAVLADTTTGGPIAHDGDPESTVMPTQPPVTTAVTVTATTTLPPHDAAIPDLQKCRERLCPTAGGAHPHQ